MGESCTATQCRIPGLTLGRGTSQQSRTQVEKADSVGEGVMAADLTMDLLLPVAANRGK